MQFESAQSPFPFAAFICIGIQMSECTRSRYRESGTRWNCDCYRFFELSRIDPRAGGLRKIFVHAAAHLLLGHRTIPVRRTRLTRDPDKRCAKGAKGPAGLAKVRVVRATERRAHLFEPFAHCGVELLPCPTVLSEQVTDASDPFRASAPLRPPHTDKCASRAVGCACTQTVGRGSPAFRGQPHGLLSRALSSQPHDSAAPVLTYPYGPLVDFRLGSSSAPSGGTRHAFAQAGGSRRCP